MNSKKNKILKKIGIILLGGLIGYGYYYFIGCNTGACPITRSPYSSIIYGLVIGAIFIFPFNNKKVKDE